MRRPSFHSIGQRTSLSATLMVGMLSIAVLAGPPQNPARRSLGEGGGGWGALHRRPCPTAPERPPGSGRLHHADSPAPFRSLLPLSRARRRQTEEGASPRSAGRHIQDAGRWMGRREAWPAGTERARATDLRRRRRPDAAARIEPVALGRREGTASALGPGRCGLPASLGLSTRAVPAGPEPSGWREHEPD